MTRNIDIARLLTATLLIGGLLLAPPHVQATPPPNFDCELTFQPDNTAFDRVDTGTLDVGTSVEGMGTVTTTGIAVLSLLKEHKADSGRDQLTVSINSQCSLIASAACTAPGTATCDKTAVSNDPAGLAAMGAALSPSSRSFQHVTPITLELAEGTLATDMASTCPGAALRGMDGYYSTSSNAIRYLADGCGVAGKHIAIFDDSGTLVSTNVLFTDTRTPDGVNVPGDTSIYGYYSYRPSPGTTVSVAKFDITTGSEVASLAAGNACGSAPLIAPKPATMHGGDAYIIETTGTCGLGTSIWSYSRINVAAWTKTESQIAFGPGGAANLPGSTRLNGWDLASDDDILACGGTSTNNAAIMKLSTNVGASIDWSSIFDPGGSSSASSCYGAKLDYQSGFFVWGSYTIPAGPAAGLVGVWIRHYTGGDFHQPTFTDHSDLYPCPAGNCTVNTITNNTIVSSNSAGNAIKSFAMNIGFTTTADLFLFGLFLVIVFMVITWGILVALGTNERTRNIAPGAVAAAGPAAIIVGIGVMLFNALVGIWQVWTAVILILICAAIVTYVLTRLFAGGRSSA